MAAVPAAPLQSHSRLPPPRVALLTALAYALVGALALGLAGPPGYASPLYPSAGIALAAAICFGRSALPGVLLGSFAVNLGVGLLKGQTGLASLPLPLWIAAGATLQAAVGAALVRRYVSRPLVLNAPGDILRFGLLGAALACCVSPTAAIPALLAAGALTRDAALSSWATWWLGDTLGVLIGAPLALTLVGRPGADWKARRRTVGLPLLAAVALLAAGSVQLERAQRQGVQVQFARDADRLASAAEARLAVGLHALLSLRSAVRAHADAGALRQAAEGWLAEPSALLQALAYSERVPVAALPEFEARARAEGLLQYRVFDRDSGAARARDGEVVALRRIEPMAGNATALGVNALSIPEARAAVVATRDSGRSAATAGFRLTQSASDETGLVLYHAVYEGTPGDSAARRALFRGVVSIVMRPELALKGIAEPEQVYLRWCLVDSDERVARRRLAGPPGCEARPAAALSTVRTLSFGGRRFELRIDAPATGPAGEPQEALRLLSLVSMAAVALLGTLLLTITGHGRRTELAVNASTAELRREIRERSTAEAALRESEARLRSILDHAPIGVMFLDPKGLILEANPRLAAMTGFALTAMRGQSVLKLVHPDEADRLQALRRQLLAGASNVFLDRVQLVDGAGLVHVARISASALRDPRGALWRMVAVLEDITEFDRLRSSERALQRAESANRAKSEFLSRMSHELRTPLNAMLGFAQLLTLDKAPAQAPKHVEWTQQIQRAGWHLLEMINETLDLARIESGSVLVDVAPLALRPMLSACRSMVSPAAAQRGVTFEESVPDDAGAVMGDATRLKQVLTNLLSNAVKYNRRGGQVRVTARRLAARASPEAAKAEVDVAPEAETGADAHAEGRREWIEITVTDTGVGMTPEQQADLFQPFNRLGRESSTIEGTGIGLVISRRLTELMGGTLTASSMAGVGSTFTLRLPAADSAEAPPLRDTDTAPAPYQQRLVHYVEDNPTNAEVMRGVFLQRPQIRLEISTLGLDGLSAIRRSRPDLVLLDMQLPDISGLELLRHLKNDDAVADIPVVVVSADATGTQAQTALTSGAEHYVTKPLDVPGFLRIVDAILEHADTRWA